MTQYRRYAVYYTPPPGAFADFGARWLGWDTARGQLVPQPDLPGLDLHEATQQPRKYGFHATLKPPFRLADGYGQNDLLHLITELAAELPPVELPGLRLARLGPFLALVSHENNIPLRNLADALVMKLDLLRAPLTQAEVLRRRPESLSVRQRTYLHRWGYPYVLEDFQFHMTLTGGLDPLISDRFEQVLKQFRSLFPLPLPIESVSVMGEADDGYFHEIDRVTLKGSVRIHTAVTGSNS
ncbi:MAG: DUF1045 domain-containing protein [Paracoccus denitrificans]|uniref:DUF1045 domain-containing protein n=1 Tax=Paracoccus denitrificans TaxID=266 RepID=A0A533IA64_PARDE|nr:MAG: DUF1045 domain-containing protein [Paracoccus denitrificans]